jgi:murein tripeptide amidase MpaA
MAEKQRDSGQGIDQHVGMVEAHALKSATYLDLKESSDHVEVLGHDQDEVLDLIQLEINALKSLSDEEFAIQQKKLLRKVRSDD